MFNIQQQEEDDFEAGRFPNEQAAAFDYSCRTIEIDDDSARLRELLAQGKFVVTSECDISCPITDAFIRMAVSIRSVHDTEEEARAAVGAYNEQHQIGPDDQQYLYVACPAAAAAPAARKLWDENDIPF